MMWGALTLFPAAPPLPSPGPPSSPHCPGSPSGPQRVQTLGAGGVTGQEVQVLVLEWGLEGQGGVRSSPWPCKHLVLWGGSQPLDRGPPCPVWGVMTSRALSELLGFAVSGPLATCSPPPSGHTETSSAKAALPHACPSALEARRPSGRPPEYMVQRVRAELSHSGTGSWRLQPPHGGCFQAWPRSASSFPGQPAPLGLTPALITKNPLWRVVKTLNSIVSPYVVRARSYLPSTAASIQDPVFWALVLCVPHSGGNAKEIEDFPDR